MSASRKEVNEVDSKVTGVIYRVTLNRCNDDEVLYGVAYIGQSVRIGTASEVANARWNFEKYAAMREKKQIGFLAALDSFGPDAFSWEILEEMYGHRSVVQKWADCREKFHIEEHGGVLKDTSKKCRQTFNQTKGGQGNNVWLGIDALRSKKMSIFFHELQMYIDSDESHTAFVPRSYANPTNGYRLGDAAHHIRRGTLLKGHPRELEFRQRLEGFRGWMWSKDKDTTARSERSKTFWRNADLSLREQWISRRPSKNDWFF